MSYINDQIFIKALKRGDEKAYMILLERYHRRLHTYAFSLIGDHARSQDIVQNVFLRVWRFREKLDDTCSIKSFLFTSIYNEFLNTFKKNKSTMKLQYKYAELLYDIASNTNDDAFEVMIEVVNNEIQNLPPKCKRVFVLSKKEGLTNLEISKFLGVSIKTVEAQITKSFTLLRKRLGDKYKAILFFMVSGKI